MKGWLISLILISIVLISGCTSQLNNTSSEKTQYETNQATYEGKYVCPIDSSYPIGSDERNQDTYVSNADDCEYNGPSLCIANSIYVDNKIFIEKCNGYIWQIIEVCKNYAVYDEKLDKYVCD